MSEELHLPQTSDRNTVYEALLPQMKALISGEKNFYANVANIMAAIKQSFPFLWVGCYFVDENELVLGPFQGPVACTRIAKGKGVCGKAWLEEQTQIVPDVDLFPGHIACSSLSKSEIVVPIRSANGNVIGVLDIDSELPADFSSIDQLHLEKITSIIAGLYVE